MQIGGKKALITGASRGIGKAITKLFLEEGAEVWGLGTKEPEDLAERQEKAEGKFHWASFDLGNLNSLEGFMEPLVKEAGGFDILVNNAGITRDKLSLRMSLDDFQKVLDINLTSSFVIARIAGTYMLRQHSGSIINMSSVAGIHGNEGQVNYAASKAGLIGLTKSLAREYAGRKVRVNAIAPGFIDSDMTAAMPKDARDYMIAHIPLKRPGQAEDVAAVALFLASGASSYITGQVIAVDGGMFI